MSTPQDRAQAYLARIGRAISRDLVAGDALISQIVELDIRKCRLLADAGLRWARERPRIQAACVVLSIDEDEWCRRVWVAPSSLCKGTVRSDVSGADGPRAAGVGGLWCDRY